MKKKNIYQYMEELPVAGTGNFVDALTITSTGLEGKLSIATVLHELQDELLVEPQKPFSFQGAKGWARGSIRYADRRSNFDSVVWSILMITGQSSEKAFKQAIRVGDVKFTRIDIAVDVAMSGKVMGLARKLKDSYRGPKQVKLIESLTGDTFYCGSRESDLMIRVYDKSEEYNEDLGMVWRFEVEYKGSRAQACAEYLAMQGNGGIPDLLWTALRESHLPSPVWGQTVDIRSRKVTVSSAQQKLNWLGSQVRPTVRWLKSLGLTNEVYEQLGLDV